MKIFELVNLGNGQYGLNGDPIQPSNLLKIFDTGGKDLIPGVGLSLDIEGNIRLGDNATIFFTPQSTPSLANGELDFRGTFTYFGESGQFSNYFLGAPGTSYTELRSNLANIYSIADIFNDGSADYSYQVTTFTEGIEKDTFYRQQVGNGLAKFELLTRLGGSQLQGFIFGLDNNVFSARVIDSAGQRGLVNDGDYEANFLPRSLITRQYLEDALVGIIGDGLIQSGTYTQDANDLDINPDWIWRTGGVTYQKLTVSEFTIIPTAPSFTRIDLISGDNTGNIILTQGTAVEDPGVAIAPSVPENNVGLFLIFVSDAGISNFEDFALSSFVRFDTNTQSLSAIQRLNARTNIQALSKDTNDSRSGSLDQNNIMRVTLGPAGSQTTFSGSLITVRTGEDGTASSNMLDVRNSTNLGGITVQKRGSTTIRARGDSVTGYFILRLQDTGNPARNVFEVNANGQTLIGLAANIPTSNALVKVGGRIAHADAQEPNESATLGQLDTAIGSINQSLPDGLISGGIVQWKETGYEYQISAAQLRELGVVDIVDGIDFVLDESEPTLDRIDVPVVSLSGGFEILKGIPAIAPVEPQPTGFQIRLTAIPVSAASLSPIDITTNSIYKENLEFVITSSGAGSVDADNTENPFEGAKAIKASNPANNSTVTATSPSDITVALVDSISLRLALIEAFANGHNIAVQFRDNADNLVSNQVIITIDKNITDYQFVAFALNQFTFTSATFRKIEIVFRRTGNQVTRQGYFIDNWILQGGVSAPPVQNNEGVQSITGNLVNNTDPLNPIVNGIQDVNAGTNVSIDKTDPANPIINVDGIDPSQYYLKSEIDPLASTGSVIAFDRPRVYGSPASPITATTLTENNTNFRAVVQTIFHQSASLTVPSTWSKSAGSEDYDPAKINVILVDAISSTYKRYTIDFDE